MRKSTFFLQNGVSTDSCDITRDMPKSIDECAATFLVNLH